MKPREASGKVELPSPVSRHSPSSDFALLTSEDGRRGRSSSRAQPGAWQRFKP
uniref:Uncharacterized protein n=1 Tax=Arundo donax TaxID=35708 RepID=A0A0A8ZKT0_ARUDO